MRKRSFRGLIILIPLLSFQVFPLPLPPDGGGEPIISPYRRDAPVTVADVTEQKRIGDSSMTATFDGGQCANVGLTYARDGRVGGRVWHRLEGVTDGRARAAVDFSVIERMSVRRLAETRGATKALFKISAFPVITPTELLNTRPTYSELAQKYRKEYEIWVEIKNREGLLSFTSAQGDQPAVCSKLADMPVNSEITFTYNNVTPDPKFRDRRFWKGDGTGLWWAIPSVTADRNYPYRRVIFLS